VFGFILRLILVIFVARWITAVVRLLRGERPGPKPPPAKPGAAQRPRSAAEILGGDVVDAEFEEPTPERKP